MPTATDAPGASYGSTTVALTKAQRDTLALMAPMDRENGRAIFEALNANGGTYLEKGVDYSRLPVPAPDTSDEDEI